MSSLGIQSGASYPIYYPEISNAVRKLTSQSEAEGPSQPKAEPDRRFNQGVGLQGAERSLPAGRERIQGDDPNTSELSVEIDKDTHRIVVKLLDSKTKEIIRQIPAEEILRIEENLKKLRVGFLDETA